ncbi:MAG TPA: hypothetical protein VFW71_01200 [Actinomycetota bacterium]|nr:hypothetical protein [Actinomycetota bacterium]
MGLLAVAASASVNPVGPLGAAVIAGAAVVFVAFLIGANERRHWGGRPPTPQEYLHGKRRMTKVQYSTAQWSQMVLVGVGVAFVLGIAMLAVGLASS